ncbi:MAG: alpha/beta hydrolase [Bacteroidota bacterium]
MKKLLLKLICCAPIICSLEAQAQELFLYKEIDTVKLYLEVYSPPAVEDAKLSPAMVFFFGGGWKSGSREHFIHHAKYFSQRGIVCFLADYRTFNKHQTDPFTSLNDAKSAMRYVRAHVEKFGIDPNKIIASGGSAGGHLAAATALIKAYDDPSDDLLVSCVPNALVLFNPVIDNGPGGYGFERVGEAYDDFSPLHNIRAGAPPTIMLLGTNDHLIPVETGEYYTKIMERVGSRCDLMLYEGGKHGFFNYRNIEFYKETVAAADRFLQSLGYLSDEPIVEIK